MKFFVIGGAGYIGSHFVAEAMAQGHSCLVFDNLSTGHRAAVPADVPLVEASILDIPTLSKALRDFKPDTILHYAALALVGESVAHPDLYYQNNVQGVANILNAMVALQLKSNLIFSSSCAVFGNPAKVPVAEEDRKAPISPYGRSKLMAEFMIEDYARAFGFKAMALRYFNACGGHEEGEIGEDHKPETHLIPNIIKSALTRQTLKVFGNTYPTKDGTCVRDYIHVTDLAIAHIMAALHLVTPKAEPFTAIHLGTGMGYTNIEIINEVERVMGTKIAYEITAPREGDATALYADNRKAKEVLGFATRHSHLGNIVRTALDWHTSHPSGYP